MFFTFVICTFWMEWQSADFCSLQQPLSVIPGSAETLHSFPGDRNDTAENMASRITKRILLEVCPIRNTEMRSVKKERTWRILIWLLPCSSLLYHWFFHCFTDLHLNMEVFLQSTARQWIARLEENDLRIIRINLPGYSDSYSNDATVFLCQLRGCYHSELPAMRQDLLSYSN